MFKLNFSFLLIFFVFHALAQVSPDEKINEVMKEADLEQNPNAKLSILKEVEIRLSDASDQKKGDYYYNLGVAYGMLYNLDSSLTSFNQALVLARKANDTLTQIGVLNGIANLAQITSDRETAQKNYEIALDLADLGSSKKHLNWQAGIRGNLAGVFFDLGDVQTALKYSKDALNIAIEAKDSTRIVNSLTQLGFCYEAIELLDSALIVHQQAAAIIKKTDDVIFLVFHYYNMGNIHLAMGNWNKATVHFDDCINMATAFSEFEALGGSLNGLGEIGLKMGDYSKADEYLNRAILFSKEKSLVPNLLRAYHLKFQLEKEKENLTEAISILTKYHALKDSMAKEESLARIDEFKVKYETSEKEKEIVQANTEIVKKQRLQTFLLLVIVLGVIALFLIIQRFRLKKALLSQEIDTLRSQIKGALDGEATNFQIDREKLDKIAITQLSDREVEILSFAMSNLTNSAIAEKTFVSVNTIKFHLKNIYGKLGVGNTREELQIALQTSKITK